MLKIAARIGPVPKEAKLAASPRRVVLVKKTRTTDTTNTIIATRSALAFLKEAAAKAMLKIKAKSVAIKRINPVVVKPPLVVVNNLIRLIEFLNTGNTK